jgi:hypothetical protein
MKKPQTEPPVMSVQEAIEQYPREWVLMDINHKASEGWLDRTGKVIHHSSDKLSASRTWRSCSAEKKAKGERPETLFLFEAVPYLRTAEEVRHALRDFIDSEEVAKWGVDEALRRRRSEIALKDVSKAPVTGRTR